MTDNLEIVTLREDLANAQHRIRQLMAENLTLAARAQKAPIAGWLCSNCTTMNPWSRLVCTECGKI